VNRSFRASGIALVVVLLTGLLLGLSLAPSELLAQTGAIRAGDLVRIRPLGVTRHDFRSYRKGTVTELAGGVIGHSLKSTKWRRVPLDGLQLGIEPGPAASN